jgi:hypothetical protein
MGKVTITMSNKSSNITNPPLPTGFAFNSNSDASVVENTDYLATSEITDNLENTKFISQVEVGLTCADVASSFVLQSSHDGTTWIDAITISSDIQPNIVGTTAWVVDTTNYYAPKWRLVANKNELDVGTGGTLNIGYTVDTT